MSGVNPISMDQINHMSTIRIYRDRADQPAKSFKYPVHVNGGRAIYKTERHKDHELLTTMCCKRKRWADNLLVHVYYDATYFFCVDGKGCKT